MDNEQILFYIVDWISCFASNPTEEKKAQLMAFIESNQELMEASASAYKAAKEAAAIAALEASLAALQGE